MAYFIVVAMHPCKVFDFPIPDEWTSGMNDIAQTLNEIQVKLTSPGAPFELVDAVVDGCSVKAYRNAYRTLPEFIDAGRVHGDKEFMVYEGDRWTFSRFYAAVDKLAAQLHDRLGIKAGERVAIAMRNRPEWAVAFAAIAAIGAVPAPLNSFGLREELSDALRIVDARFLFCDHDRYIRVEDDLSELGCRAILVDAETADDDRALLLHQLLSAQDSAVRQSPTLSPDDPALILFTSGATSRAKGVLSTQRAVCQSLCNLDYIGALAALSSPDAVKAMIARGFAPTSLVAVPLFHVSGLHALLLASLRNGRRLVMMHRWSPAHALELIRDERVTQFNGAPSMLMQLLEEPAFRDPETIKSLGGLGSGGGALPQRVIDSLTGLPNMMSGIGFGMTETNGVGAGASGQAFQREPHCSGNLSPIIELRVIGLDGTQVPVGQAGEILLRGASLMQEYWRNQQATEAAMVDGWLRTGDVGYVNEYGQLYVVDRIKDVINRNGEKIAAAEVESCLLQHPLIKEAAVFGLPDEKVGEAVVAVIVTNSPNTLSCATVQAHVKANLAAYKVPSKVHIRTDSLPRNPTGKLLKAQLKKQYLK